MLTCFEYDQYVGRHGYNIHPAVDKMVNKSPVMNGALCMARHPCLGGRAGANRILAIRATP